MREISNEPCPGEAIESSSPVAISTAFATKSEP